MHMKLALVVCLRLINIDTQQLSSCGVELYISAAYSELGKFFDRLVPSSGHLAKLNMAPARETQSGPLGPQWKLVVVGCGGSGAEDRGGSAGFDGHEFVAGVSGVSRKQQFWKAYH
ncbi:hypothetical protein CFP56_015331 [Quercus suber]|uniref:Secreted protein n=1 Tax=Quercus suber TaxID=58331 RepID=A0AAW0KSR6_QUESU